MTKAATNFEYEWMDDGTLRLRFLDQNDAILGQQIIAGRGLVPFQLLIAIAVAKHARTDLHVLLAIFRQIHFDVELSDVEALRDSIRLHVGLTDDGDVDMRTLDEE